MKKTLFAAAFLATSFYYAQTGKIGINTPNPKSTLDVNGKTDSSGISFSNETTGFQAPRLTRAELTAKGSSLYGADQKGTLIYITDVSNGTADGPRINITSTGYYFFDGTQWLKITTGTPDTDINIYKDNGTLTSNRVVTMDGKSLSFTGTNQRTILSANSGIRQEGLSNNADITLAAPDRNSNGIESRLTLQAFPESSAQVLASFDATSLDIGSNGSTSATPIRFVTSSGGNASGTEKARIAGNGNMGIGTSSPSQKLHVEGGAIVSDRLSVGSTWRGAALAVDNVNAAEPIMALSSAASQRRVTILDNGNVGIGIGTPTTKLHVVDTTNPLTLSGVQNATISDEILTISNTGIVRKNSIESILSQKSVPSPAVWFLTNNLNNFLNGLTPGNKQNTPMTLLKNDIPGMSFNAGTNTITFPAGLYQISYIYEGDHNNTGCTISSYFVDFPDTTDTGTSTTRRIHSTSSHNEGGASNHGGIITYTAKLNDNQTWQISMGRGVSGNCSGTGNLLRAKSTQLSIVRLGD